MEQPRLPALPWLAPVLLALGTAGFAAAWVLLAWSRDQQCSWMAVLGALDAVLLLRLARMRPGRARALLAAAATVAIFGLANWGIAAAQMGKPMGLLPWQALGRIGPESAWLLAGLVNQPVDVAWLGSALVFALVLGR